MKKLFLIAIVLFFYQNLFSQAPQGFKYQAVARDASGNALVSKAVAFRISILSGINPGSIVYSEVHKITTNAFGLVNFEIGRGTSKTGSFETIDWSTNSYSVKVELDQNGGTAYQEMGISQLMSVPYALHAKTVEIDKVNDADADPTNEIQILSLSGTTLSLSKSGGTVTLPSSGGGDNWGTDFVKTNATLEGKGTTSTPLKIAQQSAINGQVLKWNGTSWTPGNDAVGESGITLPYGGIAASVTPAFIVTNTTGSAIKGVNSAATGLNYGIWGESSSPDGFGVYGYNSSQMGYAKGVYGKTASVLGMGVYGYAPVRGVVGEAINPDGKGTVGFASSATGETMGIYGRAVSSSGTGVYGDGQKYGVYGISISAQGFGVYGKSANIGLFGEATSALSQGIHGESPHVGVEGIGTATSGKSWGVYGESPSVGVDGYASASSGKVYGVVGETASTEGIGVFGANYATTGINYGVYGETNSIDGGYGVYGKSHNIGVYGESSSPSGTGVYGISDGYGVRGICSSGNGAGVYGWGSQYGIKGECPTADGYSGYFHGRFVIAGWAGIGTDNPDPSYKLDVNGPLNTGSVNINCSGTALSCNGKEAIWFNDSYYSWGYGGSWNYFGDKLYIGDVAADPGANMLVVNGAAAKPGGGSWSTWSDIRLKDIQGNYEKGLKEIIALQPVKFNYKAGNACKLPSDKNYVGFIAQDVRKVFPEAVIEGEDGYLTLDVNSINVATVNAIKELKAENDKLKAENEQLNIRLTKFEKYMGK